MQKMSETSICSNISLLSAAGMFLENTLHAPKKPKYATAIFRSQKVSAVFWRYDIDYLGLSRQIHQNLQETKQKYFLKCSMEEN